MQFTSAGPGTRTHYKNGMPKSARHFLVMAHWVYSACHTWRSKYNENIRGLLDPSTGYLELRDEAKGKNIQVQAIEF
jgi:hypothetical protein